MEEKEKLSNRDERASAGPVKADAPKISKESYMMHCRGPLADGSCRMPEDTCNHPTCPARS